MDWTKLPPLSALRAFSAYADSGSVAVAGDRLNVTHAAISQQIRKLEQHMGISLLDRRARSMQLTAEGHQLAAGLHDGFTTIQATIDALTEMDAQRALQISVTPGFASGWLMPRLAHFRAKHPDFDLMIDPSADLKVLEPGGIDVALRYGAGEWTGVDCELLLRSPLVIVAARTLVGDAPFHDLKAIGQYPWLQELGTNEASNWLKKYGIERNIAHGITALPGNLMLEAVRDGQGVAIAARTFVENDLQAGRLRLLFEDDPHKGYYIVTRPGAQRPPLRSFVQWLRREAAKS